MAQKSKLDVVFGLVSENTLLNANLIDKIGSKFATQAYVNSLTGTNLSNSITVGTGLTLTNNNINSGLLSVNVNQPQITSLGTLTGLSVQNRALFTNGIDAGNAKITSVADPTLSSDCATKNYVDNTEISAIVAGQGIDKNGAVLSIHPTQSFSSLILSGTAIAVSTGTGSLQLSGGLSTNSASFFGGTVNVNGNNIINVANPIAPSDSCNKGYVDSAVTNSTIAGFGLVRNNNNININSTQTLTSLVLTGSINSTNTYSGTLQVNGGISAGGNIFAGNIYQNNVQVPYLAGTNVSLAGGYLSVVKNPSLNNIIVSGNDISNSTNTGALQVIGGLGIGGNLYGSNIYQNGNQVVSVAGSNVSISNGIINVNQNFQNIIITGTDISTNTNTGALIVAGGVAVGGTINASAIYQNGTQVPSIAGTNISISNGITSVIPNPTFSGSLIVSNTVDSTNTSSGALQILGGAAIAGSIYIGGKIYQNNTEITNVPSNPTFSGITTISNSTVSNGTGSGALLVSGGLGVQGNIFSGGNIYQNNNQVISVAGNNIQLSGNTVNVVSNPSFNGIVNINNTTNAFDTNSGSLNISGGISVAKNAFVGGNIYSNNVQIPYVAGNNINFSGNTISANLTTISSPYAIINANSNNVSGGGLLIKPFQGWNDFGFGAVVNDTRGSQSTNLVPLTNTITATGFTCDGVTAPSGIDGYYNGWWLRFGNQIRRIKSYINFHIEIYSTADEIANPTIPPQGHDFTTALTNTSTGRAYADSNYANYYDNTKREWVVGFPSYEVTSGSLSNLDYANYHVDSIILENNISFKNSQYVNLTTNGSLILCTNSSILLVDSPTGSVSSATISFPTPVDGQILKISFNTAITTFSTSNATFPNRQPAPTSITSGQVLHYIYNSATSFWWNI